MNYLSISHIDATVRNFIITGTIKENIARLDILYLYQYVLPLLCLLRTGTRHLDAKMRKNCFDKSGGIYTILSAKNLFVRFFNCSGIRSIAFFTFFEITVSDTFNTREFRPSIYITDT